MTTFDETSEGVQEEAAPASAVRAAPTVPIIGEHSILAEALHRVLPHVRKAEKDTPPMKTQHLIIEPDGTIAATDGVTIAAYRYAVTPPPGVRVLLELPDVDSQTMIKRLAKKAAKDDPLFGVNLAPSGNAMTLTVGRESLTITPSMHADEYPNWRNLFVQMRDAQGRKEPAALIGLYPEKLDRFGGVVQMAIGGAHDAVIVRYTYEPNFWGAIMPARVEAPADPFPTWCAADDFTPKPETDG